MPKPRLKKDRRAIQLLEQALKLLGQYRKHVVLPLDPDEENYRDARGMQIEEEIEDLLKEEREGWHDDPTTPTRP